MQNRSIKIVAGLLGIVAGLAGQAVAQTDFGNAPAIITSGLSSPVGIYAPPGDDTRLFVVEQGGRIRLIRVTETNGVKSYALVTTPVLDLNALDTSRPFFTDASGNPLRDQANVIIPRIVRNGGTAVPNPSTGLTHTVSRGSEQGLLGLAFAPDYATSGRFFINYVGSNPNTNPGDSIRDGDIAWSFATNGGTRTATHSGRTVIAEFQINPANRDVADTNTERMIINIPQDFTNHNGGHILFEKGTTNLLIGMGDGGSGNDPNNRALNPNSLLGKMLRIDISSDGFPADANRNYAIPANNPFATSGGAPEIWARGLRNPWKFSIDRWNGDMWIGDVGQDAWEEINHVSGIGAPGLNYGWRVREGNRVTGLSTGGFDASTLEPPSYVYPRSSASTDTIFGSFPTANDIGQSTVGGFRYRGSDMRGWRGKYFFADTVRPNVWMGDFNSVTGRLTNVQNIVTTLRTTVGGVTPPAFSSIVAFGEDNQGELFIVEIVGRIRKMVADGTQPAIADVGAEGGAEGSDAIYDNNDFIVFVNWFFDNDPRADIGVEGGARGSDQLLDNNDFIVFIDAFFNNQ
jgi:glucose/arabinose dehydrogenase